MVPKSSAIVSTSFTIGTLDNKIFLFDNMVEANMGRVAFLEPEMEKKVDYIDDLPSSNHPKFNEETIYLTN